jgi:nucleoside-diphosphate-sugar epimerase
MTVQIQRALVTGGAGFIGSHIAEALVNQGCHVTVLDNLSTGHIANLKGIEAAITFIEGDIRDSRDVGMAIEQCDAVFHHAAVVSVTQTVSDPVASTEVNDLGTLRVLDAARLNGVRRVVLASSSAVYGDDPSCPRRNPSPAVR